MGKRSRLTKAQFLEILRDNAGLYARTSRAIEKVYGFPMTRQAVRQRAEKYPEELKDIQEQTIDVAEETVLDVMRKGKDRERLDAAKFLLKTIGRIRGYVEKQEIDVVGKTVLKWGDDDNQSA